MEIFYRLKYFRPGGLFVVILILRLTICQAGQVWDVRQITNADGLSNSSVNKIFQDSDGLLWIGTWDGLNLYNGSDFTVFHPELNHPNCISNQVILDITEDGQGRIWINTNHGINRYDKKTNTFTRYYFSRKNISRTKIHNFVFVFENKYVAKIFLRTGNDLETSEILFVSSFC